jgi:thymidylate synthase (FAD)
MRIVEARARVQYPETQYQWILELMRIANAGRVSRGVIDDFDSYTEAAEFVMRLIKRKHLSVLEFGSMTVMFTVDRAVANEITRHRHISCVQESTRYVCYTEDIPVIKPGGIPENTKMYGLWENAVLSCESAYHEAIQHGLEPDYARSMLPACLAATLTVKANFREWRHIFALRTSKAAHPDMREVMSGLAEQCAERCPAVFAGDS